MRIFFLAPQPFFQERGTPIAVRLALRVIAERQQDNIDLLTFAEGQDLHIPNVRLWRIWSPLFLRGIRPGFSFKKLLCDVIFFITAFYMILKAHVQGRKFALLHAVEESVFMALFFKIIFGIPYIYDMDSSLAIQLTDKFPCLRLFKPFFSYLETCAIRSSLAVIPVCDALAVIAQRKSDVHVQVLPDISLHTEPQDKKADTHNNQALDISVNLRIEAGISENAEIVLYVGNLEHYQGVEMLIESFARISEGFDNWYLVIIGGSDSHISKCLMQSASLGIQDKVRLLGTRPVSSLSYYLKQATILASPRILGNNTPMKIYSYMHSGVAIIATNLPTHSQVLDQEMAYLAGANIEDFANGLKLMMSDSKLRKKLADRAFSEAEQKYTFPVFRKTLLEIYDQVEIRLGSRN